MARIAENHGRLQAALTAAESLRAAGRLDEAIAAAHRAASGAWLDHPGSHVSPRLERLLGSLAVDGAAVRDAPAGDGQLPGRILHVLSQAYGTGGHTRLARRWMLEDAERRHTVVLTGQGDVAVPPELDAAAAARDGTVRHLDEGPARQRAAALRALSAEADLVVLHAHPNDPLPLLSFARPVGLPPVVHLNHADHAFWIGVTGCDLVVHCRASGQVLSARRRAIPETRSAILPIPLDPAEQSPARARAKAALGLEPHTTVLLSVAEPYKYLPLRWATQPRFLDLMIAVLQRAERSVFYVVGPSGTDEWADAARRTGGRLQALGRVTDLARLRAAADIYVDSFPVGSATSMLEAGIRGLPLVAHCPHTGDAAALSTDAPGLDEVTRRSGDPDSTMRTLLDLIRDEEARWALGQQTAAAIRAHHSGPGWLASAEAVYRQAMVARAAGGRIQPPDDLEAARHGAIDRALAGLRRDTAPLPPVVITHQRMTPV